MSSSSTVVSATSSSTSRGQGQHLLAAIVSLVLPGFGQLLLGRIFRGILLLVLFFVGCLGFWPLRLPDTTHGLRLFWDAWIVLVSCAVLDSLLLPRPGFTPPEKWWLGFFIPAAFPSTLMVLLFGMLATGFRAFEIPSTSMKMTLLPGDRIAVDMWYYHSRLPRDGDVVIYRRNGIFMIKRVIASEGETIEGKNAQVLVNGNRLNEPYVIHTADIAADSELSNFGPQTIPAHRYFVMGDSRDISFDSRTPEHGLVDLQSIEGKPLYIYLSSLGRVGKEIR